jgi:hypothetical protein
MQLKNIICGIISEAFLVRKMYVKNKILGSWLAHLLSWDFDVRDAERCGGGGGREEHVGAANDVVHGLEEEDAAGYAEEERHF